MHKLGMLGLVSGAAVLLSPVTLHADESKDDKVAEVVLQFLKCIKDKNADELMKAAAVPWLAEEQKVLKDAKDLRKHLDKTLAGVELPKGDLKVINTKKFSDSEEFVKDKAARKLLKETLGDNGFLVLVGDKKTMAVRYVLVRLGESGPKVVGGPYRLTYLLMPNPIPDVVKGLFDKAPEFELLSLDPSRLGKEKPADSFHGWKVLGRTTVKDAKARKDLLVALRRAAEENDGIAAACFNPRHGIRFAHDGKTVDLVICFECFQVQVYEGDTGEKGFLVTASAQPAFDKLLRDAGVALPKKEE